jgi:hypothetical protein
MLHAVLCGAWCTSVLGARTRVGDSSVSAAGTCCCLSCKHFICADLLLPWLLLLLQVAYCTAAVAFEDGRRPQFEIEYDMVVVAVGEQPATFGVPGAQLGQPGA